MIRYLTYIIIFFNSPTTGNVEGVKKILLLVYPNKLSRD